MIILNITIHMKFKPNSALSRYYTLRCSELVLWSKSPSLDKCICFQIHMCGPGIHPASHTTPFSCLWNLSTCKSKLLTAAI